jgi:hypothetical protein
VCCLHKTKSAAFAPPPHLSELVANSPVAFLLASNYLRR